MPDDIFNRQIDHIIEVEDEYLQNNCIAEVKKRHTPKVKPKVKMVSRRTQTYLKDLLFIEGYE